MTSGQERALGELERIHNLEPNELVLSKPIENEGVVGIEIGIRIGPIESRSGGLEFKEREYFFLIIPEDFPFSYPIVRVFHTRFAGFPHVIWSKYICLYQSVLEWNPSDGMFGFLDRLDLWIERAALNDMDPIDGPLEPPHHNTDFSRLPFVIRKNTPVEPGEFWLGFAEVEKFENRYELTGWSEEFKESTDKGKSQVIAIILKDSLPMEFPTSGADFFAELEKQNIDKHSVIRYLALASVFRDDQDPIHLILCMPMRRAADGEIKHHVAIWVTDKFKDKLHQIIPKESDSEQIKALRNDMLDIVLKYFSETSLKWCRVLEDRDEIIVRRDKGRPTSWFKNRAILLLGCGGLGSWAADIIARSEPKILHLVDNSIVKPGLLVRQNFQRDDIGKNKAIALAEGLKRAVPSTITIEGFDKDAFAFLTHDNLKFGYDLVLDFSASSILQMKLERDWEGLRDVMPKLISTVIDAKASNCISVGIDAKSPVGIWSHFIQLKSKICSDGLHEIISSFYSEDATKDLFQPEPGCSDPTYSASAADLVSLVSKSLNLNLQVNSSFPFFGTAILKDNVKKYNLSKTDVFKVGDYKMIISSSVFIQSKAWVKQNSRIRSKDHETGGLIWGLWDDAIKAIWVFDVSGPPPDSVHNPGHFLCGTQGIVEDHLSRFKNSNGVEGFLGYWHTHPGFRSEQSAVDIEGMADVVSKFGSGKGKALMFIYGRTKGSPTLGIYIYQSKLSNVNSELLLVKSEQIKLQFEI